MDDFFKGVINRLKELETLKITTIVGSAKTDAKGDFTLVKEKEVEGMQSEIQLIEGDIKTTISGKFADEHEQLREFHMLKERQGLDIIEKNLEVIKKLGLLVLDFSDPENRLKK